MIETQRKQVIIIIIVRFRSDIILILILSSNLEFTRISDPERTIEHEIFWMTVAACCPAGGAQGKYMVTRFWLSSRGFLVLCSSLDSGSRAGPGSV